MPEETYVFRLRYTRSPRDTVNYRESIMHLPTTEPDHEVIIKARDRDNTIEASGSLILHGAGWATPEEAERHGHFYSDILVRVCARLRLGADFGDRTGKSAFTKEGLEAISKQTGRPALNDIHGLMIYEQTSQPTLASISMRGDLVRGINFGQFLDVYSSTLSRPREISEHERVALSLFNSSFFQESCDSRFLLMMMGVEALIEQRQRSDNVTMTVQGFLSTIDAIADLNSEEKAALKSGLGNLQRESIRQAGRRLIRERLGTRKYKEMPAEDFFKYCYDIRSRLVHGELPPPTWDEVNSAAGSLEVMLSDLLSTDLLDVGPQPEI
jgi:hypothetical protein